MVISPDDTIKDGVQAEAGALSNQDPVRSEMTEKMLGKAARETHAIRAGKQPQPPEISASEVRQAFENAVADLAPQRSGGDS